MSDQPPFVFEGQPDREMITTAVRHVSRPSLWILYGFGIAVALFGAGTIVAGDVGTGVVFIVVGVAWTLVMPAYAIRKAVRRCMKLIGHRTAYRVDDEGVAQNNAMAASIFRWPMIIRVDELPGQVVLRVGKAQFVPLPTTSMSGAQRAAMVAFLRARMAGAGAPRASAQPLPPPTP
jgi:hypothetical protein